MAHQYLIENRWLTAPTKRPLFSGAVKCRIEESTSETIVQIVKPPREFGLESTIRLRELWQAGIHYFPVVWQAPEGIYKNPVVVIEGADHYAVVRAKHKPNINKDFTNARYVAVVEQNQEAITFAVSSPSFTRHLPGRILGVFERDDSARNI